MEYVCSTVAVFSPSLLFERNGAVVGDRSSEVAALSGRHFGGWLLDNEKVKREDAAAAAAAAASLCKNVEIVTAAGPVILGQP